MKKAILGLMLLGVVCVSSFGQMMGMEIDDSKMKVKVLKPGSEPKYQLKQDFPIGKYRMTMDMAIKMTMASADQAPMPTNVTMKFVVLVDVSDYDEAGIKTLKMAYESVEMVTPMGSGKAVRGEKKDDAATSKPAAENGDDEDESDEAAATKPAAGMMQTQAEQLVALEGIVVKMDKTGKIVKVEGFENMPGGQAEMITNLVKDVSTSQKYPAVGVGGSFDVTAEAEMPMMGTMIIDTVTTLDSVDKSGKDTLGKLKSQITMSVKKDETEAPKKDEAKKDKAKKDANKDADSEEDEDESDADEAMTAPKLDMQMNAKGEFTTTMDLTTGLAIESNGTLTNDMTVQAGPQGEMKMHQVIEMKMKTEAIK